MIVELSTNFSDMEKSLLKDWADVDIKLYIDLNKLINRLYAYDYENKMVIGELIEEKAIELPNMMPNRIICVGLCHWLVERKNEPGSWYMGSRGEDGIIDCWGKYDDLETALKSI